MRSLLSAVLVSLALILALAGPVRAQDDNKPPESPEKEMARQMIKILKDELDLTEDQLPRVTSAIEDGLKEGFKRMMKHMGEENPDQEQMKKEGDEVRTNILSKIRDCLDDEQKKEFEVLVKEFDQRAGKFQRGGGAPGGDAALWLDGELPSKERLLLKAENVLLLTEDEKKVVLPKVEAVVVTREKMREAKRDQRKSLSQAVGAKAKEDEVRERLHALRNKQAELSRTLSKAEDDLRELLTLDQEARLVAIGILD